MLTPCVPLFHLSGDFIYHFVVYERKYFFSHFFILASLFFRMQALAVEQSEKIETVNRERKYHQVS